MQPYKILELDPSATAQEIKKAYFRLVRVYTPEKSPEKFKEIRAAYEYLQDKDNLSNLAYLSSIPEEFQKPYEQVLTFMQSADYHRVANLCIEILSITSIEAFEVALGKAYLALGNSGKAIKLWSDLCQKHEDNYIYLEYLGDAYQERGWTKKAFEIYQYLFDNKPKCISLYGKVIASLGDDTKNMPQKSSFVYQLSSYIETKDTLSKEEHQELYNIILSLSTEDNTVAADTFTLSIANKTLDICSKFCSDFSGYYHILMIYMMNLVTIYEERLLGIDLVTRYNDFLTTQRLHLTTQDATQLIITQSYLESLYINQDKLIHPHFIEYSSYLYTTYVLHTSSDLNEMSKIFSDEMSDLSSDGLLWDFYLYIAAHLEEFRPTLNKVKTDYPILASYMGEVLDEMIQCRNTRELANKYERKLRRIMKIPSNQVLVPNEPSEQKIYDSTESGTYRREEPKIERNAPCPCGSGKKYKKCCGR